MLFEVWAEMTRPALELLAPRLRQGAVICADNTTQARDGYRRFFEYIADPANGLRTMTLPFDGGFEMTVKLAPAGS